MVIMMIMLVMKMIVVWLCLVVLMVIVVVVMMIIIMIMIITSWHFGPASTGTVNVFAWPLFWYVHCYGKVIFLCN